MTIDLKGLDFKAIAAAALLLAALNVPCRAEDAPAAPPAAADQATPGDTKSTPTDVPRPSITAKSTDKSTDTAAGDAASEPAPHHRRHYAHRYYYRHYAYWEPFPIFFPHLYHNRIVWNRVSWFHF